MPPFEFEAIGTHWRIDIDESLDEHRAAELLGRIHERIDAFDKAYSRFRDDSLVMEMSRKAGQYVLPDDAKPMMELYQNMWHITGGKVTPLIGQVLSDAGYDAAYSMEEKPLTAPKQWQEVIQYVHPTLTLSEPALLDFGAAGKGYLVDLVGEVVEAFGIKSYCVDAGGDIRQRSTVGMPLRVGLEDPRDTTQAVGLATILNRSICGSAGNRRRWSHFHHIIDPHTLQSPENILAVWTVAADTLTADMLTTGLFFLPPEELKQHFSFEYIIVYADLSSAMSAGFPGEIFTS